MNIRKLREDNNYTQEEVAVKLGISRFTYGNYENEKTQAPYYILKMLSNIYNVTIDYILDNNINGKVVYSENQKNAITDLCKLNDDYLELASKYIKNLLADQVELENKRKLFN